MFDYSALIFPDGNRLIMDGQYAGFFAGCRTDSSCKFRETVGLGQDGVGFVPFTMVNGILPFRDVTTNRTSPVAKWYAAIHAPRCLIDPILIVKCLFNLAEISYALTYGAITTHFSFYLNKTLWISHVAFN